MSLLEVHLPLELATRSLALYNYENDLTCEVYMEQAGMPSGTIDDLCPLVNFTSV
jgi:hypothetical protein